MPTTVPTELAAASMRELSLLRSDVLNHQSSYAALCICLREKPHSLRVLLEIVGVTHRQVGAFDACADAYTVYEDGCMRGKLSG